MGKIISPLLLGVLLCSILIYAQTLGVNCADDCQNKIKSCRATCAQFYINKRAYNKCMDNCDDAWRDCRKKCN